jgi:putative ABC transport system substrate-binding protein
MNRLWTKKIFLIMVPIVVIILATIAGCQGSPEELVKAQPQIKAQPKKTYHVGVVSFGGGQNEVILGVQEGMKALGYEEGNNIVYTIIDAKGSNDQVKAAAEEFLRQRVDAVYSASTPVTIQVAQVIKEIPIVFNIVSDPVGAGLAKSLTASGTNLTGCSNFVGQTGPKRLEVLRTMLPNLQTVLVLYDPTNKFSQDAIVTLREAANTLAGC